MKKIAKPKKYFLLKKQMYRKLAAAKKSRWAAKHQLQHQEQYKYHFTQSQSNEDSSDCKKLQPKEKTKIRNRVAAQESREKKKNYVEQLQRKIIDYELVLEKQLCKNCLKSLAQPQDSTYSKEVSVEKIRIKDSCEEDIEDYLEESVIRIDNQGVTTPYAFFYVICFITVLAVFTFASSGGPTDKRVLVSDKSLVGSIEQEESIFEKPFMNNYFQITSFLKMNSPFSSSEQNQTGISRYKEAGLNIETKKITEQMRTNESNYTCVQTTLRLYKQSLKDDEIAVVRITGQQDGQSPLIKLTSQTSQLIPVNWIVMQLLSCKQSPQE